jgi:hypothetical protein
MASTVAASVNNQGVKTITITVNTAASALAVYVGDLRQISVQVHRGAGSADTMAITGSNDGTTYAAVVGEASTDVALTAVTAAINNIRQRVAYLKFTPSGNTDTFTIVISGQTRN